jgi:4-cresol dehydrogenase (hydroxylating) flavoprotein subunit
MVVEVKSIIQKIAQIVGEENVIHDKETLDLLSYTGSNDRVLPSLYIYPNNVEQLCQIVSLANKEKLALWPCSRGQNWGYGSAAPIKPDSAMVVLSKLNKIHEVNEKLAYAVIEPGVTYQQLYDYIKKHNYKLMVDCIGCSPSASIIGNALERGVGFSKYHDHCAHVSSFDVVLPNGELMVTSHPSNASSRYVYKWAVGPYVDGLFIQGNFGIIVKAGIMLMPQAKHMVSVGISINASVTFDDLIPKIRSLISKDVFNSAFHMVNASYMMTYLTENPEEKFSNAGFMTNEEVIALARRNGIGLWNISTAIYGSYFEVLYKKIVIYKELRAFGKVRFINDFKAVILKKSIKYIEHHPTNLLSKIFKKIIRILSGKTNIDVLKNVPPAHDLMKGIPTEQLYSNSYFNNMNRNIEEIRDIKKNKYCAFWVSPIVPFRAKDMEAIVNLLSPLYEKYGFRYSYHVALKTKRSVIMINPILFDTENDDEVIRAYNLYSEVEDVIGKSPYQIYRAHINVHEEILKRNPNVKKLLNSVKRAVDPNNIISPGRYNIGG